MAAVGFEPTPFRNSALSYRLRPLGQTTIIAFALFRVPNPSDEKLLNANFMLFTAKRFSIF